MSRLALTLVSILLLSLFTLHQSYSQPDYFHGTVHLSLPIEDFSDEDGGLAKAGWLMKGLFDHFVNNKNLGICGGVMIGYNAFDVEAIDEN